MVRKRSIEEIQRKISLRREAAGRERIKAQIRLSKKLRKVAGKEKRRKLLEKLGRKLRSRRSIPRATLKKGSVVSAKTKARLRANIGSLRGRAVVRGQRSILSGEELSVLRKKKTSSLIKR